MLVRHHPTLDITPEDARDRASGAGGGATDEARRAAGLPANRDSLRAMLRGDRFVPSAQGTVPEVIARLYEDAARRLEPVFGAAPLTPLAVSQVSEEEANAAPLAFFEGPSVSQPIARYRINLQRLPASPMVILPGLVFQDLMPGMHWQVTRQREDGSLPPFRRTADHAGFVRGWSAYALAVADSLSEQLGTGQRFGVRLRQLANACGLVVDTGINALGWSRTDALAFCGPTCRTMTRTGA